MEAVNACFFPVCVCVVSWVFYHLLSFENQNIGSNFHYFTSLQTKYTNSRNISENKKWKQRKQTLASDAIIWKWTQTFVYFNVNKADIFKCPCYCYVSYSISLQSFLHNQEIMNTLPKHSTTTPLKWGPRPAFLDLPLAQNFIVQFELTEYI